MHDVIGFGGGGDDDRIHAPAARELVGHGDRVFAVRDIHGFRAQLPGQRHFVGVEVYTQYPAAMGFE